MKAAPRNKPFGEIALQKKYITLDQLLHALNAQSLDDIETGEHKLIGTILFEQGSLDLDQYNEVLNHCWFTRANAEA